MKFNRLLTARILLILGSIYYFIGAIAHFFGLTIFPFFSGTLYVPYQDTVIALVAIILAILLWTVSRDPIKNSDVYNVILIGGILAIIFSVIILLRIDFNALNALDKKLQTIVEMILLMVYTSLLWMFRPKKAK